MSGIACEQENHILDQMSGRQMSHKNQPLETKQNVKSLKTPMTHKSGPKTSLGKSSRKAFGNVSNVLRSGSQQSIGPKVVDKLKASTKESEPNLKSDETKSNIISVETDPKFLDEIEEMYPIGDQLMSDMKDSITDGLFAIDEHIVFGMGFDSDMSEALLPNKGTFDLNDFL